MGRLADWLIDGCWLEDLWCLAGMTGKDLASWITLVDVPKSSGNQGWLGDSQCLEDPATFDPHCDLRCKVEWIWLNSCPEAIDMAFIDPAFADWALGNGRQGIDE